MCRWRPTGSGQRLPIKERAERQEILSRRTTWAKNGRFLRILENGWRSRKVGDNGSRVIR
jgi:hypothetical protein